MFNEYLRMAISSIRARRLRSFVTLLGVIIGVAGVITSVSLAQGIKNQVTKETSKLGGDVLTIRPGVQLNPSSGIISGINFLGPDSTTSVLTEKDLATVRDTDGVRLSVPLSLISGLPTTGDTTYNESVIIGTTPGLASLLSQDVEFGNFFDENSDANFAVIGSSVAEKLFKEFVPIGQSFKLRGRDFVVQGVLERQAVASFSQGIDFNKAIFIPYDTVKDINKGTGQSYEILAQVNHPEDLNKTAELITKNLAANHGGQEDFTVLKANETQAVTDSVINLISSMLAIIAAISMLVGGIGIMNVMLVSVSERTHEIGIRKAVGATNRQIAGQFMTEAIVLSTWGAIIGIIISLMINLGFRILTNIQPAIVWEIIFGASALSIVIGVVFGAAPAIKAARKKPIDALRSDS